MRRKRARGGLAVGCCVSGKSREQLEAELCVSSARTRAGVGRRCAVPCRRPSVPSAASVVCERQLREKAPVSPRGQAGGGERAYSAPPGAETLELCCNDFCI